MRIFVFVILAIVASSCNSDSGEEDWITQDPSNVLINYYFSVKPFGEYNSLAFSFNNLRADQLGLTYRTVYLDPASIQMAESFSRIGLGSSLIEPIAITGFSFGSSQFVVSKGNDTIPLILNESSFDVASELTFEGPDTLDITFELDLQASVVLDSAGIDWIIPKVNVLKE
ncbi:MAG: hypothetical protein WA958_21995 [Tunicatimonas sp.]